MKRTVTTRRDLFAGDEAVVVGARSRKTDARQADIFGQKARPLFDVDVARLAAVVPPDARPDTDTEEKTASMFGEPEQPKAPRPVFGEKPLDLSGLTAEQRFAHVMSECAASLHEEKVEASPVESA
jgi:hypothetical protein